MHLLTLIEREGALPTAVRIRFFGLAALSGGASAAILAIVNAAAENVTNTESNMRFLVMFLVANAVFILTQTRVMTAVCQRVEEAIHSMRLKILERARHAELLDIERIGRSEIFACISRETQTIAQAAPSIVIGAQSAVLVAFTLVYMAFLSPLSAILSVAFTVLGGWFHFKQSGQIKRQLADAYTQENMLVDRFTDMLDGFKEVKMSTARSADLSARIVETSRTVTDLRIATQTLYSKNFAFSQVTFYMLTGMLVFVVPNIDQTYADVVLMTTTASLFMIGPISNVVGSLPIFNNAEAAAGSLIDLEQRLSKIEPGVADTAAPITRFNRIAMDRVVFRYPEQHGESGFVVGPIDLEIERGETVFITGGNGSGKTTMIRVLIGLYPATEGVIRIDGEPIGKNRLTAYRNLFAVVFADNHLFGELYGIETIDPVRADALFEVLEMRHKARLEGRRFSTTTLSGGQRKRLALIAAVLEQRPIVMFDEWAADQDPHFRKRFYREILPMLKAEGITVLAITHDDAYFDAADKHVHLEAGRLKVVPSDPGHVQGT